MMKWVFPFVSQVVHHESLFRRRGRPVGPAPLGRGFATTQEYIQALEEEAEEEAR